MQVACTSCSYQQNLQWGKIDKNLRIDIHKCDACYRWGLCKMAHGERFVIPNCPLHGPMPELPSGSKMVIKSQPTLACPHCGQKLRMVEK